jgi:hypothetical protein
MGVVVDHRAKKTPRVDHWTRWPWRAGRAGCGSGGGGSDLIWVGWMRPGVFMLPVGVDAHLAGSAGVGSPGRRQDQWSGAA